MGSTSTSRGGASHSGAPKWSFYGDHGWIECTRSGSDSAVYEALYQQCIKTKTPTASLDAGGFTYTLDFVLMEQTNEDYGTTRRLDRNPRPVNCPLQSLPTSTTSTPADALNEYRQYLTTRQNSTTMVPIPTRKGMTKIESHIQSEFGRLKTAVKKFSNISFRTTPLSYFQTAQNFTDSAPYVSYEHYVAWVEAVENGTTGSFPYSTYINGADDGDDGDNTGIVGKVLSALSSSKSSKSSSKSSKSDKKDKKSKKDKKDKKGKKGRGSSSTTTTSSSTTTTTTTTTMASMPLPDPNEGFFSWFPSLDLNPFSMVPDVKDEEDCGMGDGEECGMGDDGDGMGKEKLTKPKRPPQIDDQDHLTCAICMCALWDREELDDDGAMGSGDDDDSGSDDDDDDCCDEDDCWRGKKCGRKPNKIRFPKDQFPEETIVQLSCSHFLHTNCLVGQFQGAGSHSGSCPICKVPILITAGPMPDADCDLSFTRDKCAGFPTSPGTI